MTSNPAKPNHFQTGTTVDRPSETFPVPQPYNPQPNMQQAPTYAQETYSTPHQSYPPQMVDQNDVQSPQQSLSSTVYDDELTEAEREEYEKGVLTWAKCKNWRFWIRKEWLWYYVIFVVLVVLVALMTFFHKSVSTVRRMLLRIKADRLTIDH